MLDVQSGKLAAILARAFYDDPAMKWVLVDDARRLGVPRGELAA
jgi:hypothetical protein